jgi:hypothetical protein
VIKENGKEKRERAHNLHEEFKTKKGWGEARENVAVVTNGEVKEKD